MNISAIELVPAVIYARFSSSGQREESIIGQIRDCRSYADRFGYRILRTYEDRAKTGTNDNRPAFQQMIRDSAKHQFQAVIVWKLDRFSRDKYDAARYKHVLSQNGVHVISAMEPISSNPEGVIMESLLEGMAQYYSMDLSMKVKRGNRESAMEHKTVGMRMIGYKPDETDHFQIDPATAPIVKRIFEEYVSGKQIGTIIDGLNTDGIRTLRGKPWSKTSLQHILRNERYTGVYIFGDYREENAMPAIISKDLWNQCQTKIKEHKIAPAASRSVKYLLTGKIFCGLCGSPLIGASARGRLGKKYYYYQDTKRKDPSCPVKRVQKDQIESVVLTFLINKVSDAQFISDLADLVMRYQEQKSDSSELEALQAQMSDVKQRLHNLEEAVEHGVFNDSTQERMMELIKRKESLSEAISAAELISPVRFTREQIIAAIEHLRGNPKDPRYADRLIDIFLNAVYVYPDDHKLLISINYQGEQGEPVSYETALSAYESVCVSHNNAHHIVQNTNTAVLITDHAAMFVSTY